MAVYHPPFHPLPWLHDQLRRSRPGPRRPRRGRTDRPRRWCRARRPAAPRRRPGARAGDDASRQHPRAGARRGDAPAAGRRRGRGSRSRSRRGDRRRRPLYRGRRARGAAPRADRVDRLRAGDPARRRRAAGPRHAPGGGAGRSGRRARVRQRHRRLFLGGGGSGGEHGELQLRGDPAVARLGRRRQPAAAGPAERGHGHRSAQRPDRTGRQSGRESHRRRQHRDPQHQPLSDAGGVGRRHRPIEYRPDSRRQLLGRGLRGRARRPALVGDGRDAARWEPHGDRRRDLHEHGRRRPAAGGAAGRRARVVGAVGAAQLPGVDCRRRGRHRHRRHC